MDRSPVKILETVAAAQTVVPLLDHRVSVSHSIVDLGDLSVIQTTVRKIEDLLEYAAAYGDILRRQLERTNARLVSPSP